MNREEAHKLIDQLFDSKEPKLGLTEPSEATVPEPKKELPKDKRVVRTKQSGDRVYLIDEVKKTRQWVSNPEVLSSLGFDMTDVGEIEDSEMIRYQMAAAIYKVDQ